MSTFVYLKRSNEPDHYNIIIITVNVCHVTFEEFLPMYEYGQLPDCLLYCKIAIPISWSTQ